MPHRVQLQDRTLIALKAAEAGNHYDVFDSEVPSFGVRVYDKVDAKGKARRRSFFLLSRYPGSPNPTRRVLGVYPAISLAEAREKARAWLRLIAKGVDPRDDEQRVRDEAASAKAEAARAKADKDQNTFRAVAELYIADRSDKRRAKADAQEVRRILVGELGDKPIADIAPRDLRELFNNAKRRSPYDARNAWGHAVGIFKRAVHEEIIVASPMASLDKKLVFAGVRIAPRQRTFTDDEIFAYWRAADHMPYPVGPFYKLLMLTATRLNELAKASRSELHPEIRRLLREGEKSKTPIDWTAVDDAVKIWTIPPERFKSDTVHVVQLTDDALRVLETIPTVNNCDWLFTVDGRNAVHIGNKYKKRFDVRMLRTLRALARIRGDDPAGVKLAAWKNHDVRHVVRTGVAALHVVEDKIEELVLGHGRKGIGRIYDHNHYGPEVRRALVAWADRLREIVEPKRAPPLLPPNVTPLSTARKAKALA